MKKTINIALLFVFFAFTNAAAQDNKTQTPQEKTQAEQQTQERKITDAEFKAVQKKSDDKTKGKSFRMKKSSKTYKRADNSLAFYFDETIERAASGDWRTVAENGSAGGGAATVTETIRAGQKTYTRLNNGAWSVSDKTPADNQRNTPTPESVEYIYKGKVEINNQTADLYETKTISKTVKGGRDFVTTTIIKNYFGADGVLFRTEEEIETNNTVTKRTTEYEYDANIKIEAPM